MRINKHTAVSLASLKPSSKLRNIYARSAFAFRRCVHARVNAGSRVGAARSSDAARESLNDAPRGVQMRYRNNTSRYRHRDLSFITGARAPISRPWKKTRHFRSRVAVPCTLCHAYARVQYICRVGNETPVLFIRGKCSLKRNRRTPIGFNLLFVK